VFGGAASKHPLLKTKVTVILSETKRSEESLSNLIY
jgi:hypothetical protein